MYTAVHVKYPLSDQILIKFELSRRIFEKYSNIEFHENPSSGRRFAARGRTDGHEKLIVAFRSSVNALKNSTFSSHGVFMCCMDLRGKKQLLLPYKALTDWFL
jgi:hypothetical protein